MSGDSPAPPVIPDYELLKPIGRGSYGEVWLARSVTGVFRVIKVVRRDRFEDDRPFRRELGGISRYQAAVSGRPRQLALLHVGRNDAAGYFYYVMEPADDVEAGSAIDPERYVPLTLREMFLRRGRLPAAECVQIALELARGLAVLHGENLIHRDIKPSNVIFVQRVPKLADVGLVAATEASLSFVGTPGYLPPEGPGTVAADIYSFGKVLYEIATGFDRLQFPRLPSDLTDGPETRLLGELNAVVVRACHPDPRQRHPTIEALARDLEFIQAGRSVAFYEDLRKRLRVLTAAALAVLVVGALITTLVLWRAGVVERANEEIRRALYRSDLAVAQLAKASGDLGRARAALQRQVPAPGETDLRGLEWAILHREVQGEGTPLEPFPDPVAVTRIVTDPTGRWVAASFSDDRAGIWELTTGRLVRVLTNVRVLGGFLNDGRLVVDEPERALRFESPTENNPTRIETGQRLFNLLPDGRFLVVTPKDDLIFKLLDQGAVTIQNEFNLTAWWPEPMLSVSDASPDGKHLILGLLIQEGARRTRWLASIDLETSIEEWRRPLMGRVLWIASSSDNTHFAANIGGGLIPSLMRVDDPNSATALAGHTARVEDARFAYNGRFLATASADQTIRVWEVPTGRLLSTHIGLGRSVRTVAWNRTDSIVLGGDDTGNLRAFPFPKEPNTSTSGGLFADVAGDLVLSPSGQNVAVTSTTNSIAIISTKGLTTENLLTNVFQPIRWDNTEENLLAFASDWSVRSVSLDSGRSSPMGLGLPKGFTVRAYAQAQDPDLMAVCGRDGKVALLNFKSREIHITEDPESEAVWSAHFSGDSETLFTGTEAGSIRSWNAKTGDFLSGVARAPGEVQALALSPDGQFLAASLYEDASVRIWNRSIENWTQNLTAHRRFAGSLLFTKDSKRLISGGTDGRVVLWRVPEFEEIAAFEVAPVPDPTGDEGIAVLRLSKDETTLAALTEDGRLQLWIGNLRTDGLPVR